MYALQPEPEEGRRWRVLTVSAVCGTLLYGAIFNITSKLEPHRAQPKTQRIQMQVMQIAPRVPKAAPEPPKPEPQQQTPKQQAPKPKTPKDANKPQAMPLVANEPPPPPSAAEPPPLVVGLTLSSTTRSGNGPRFAVGNTLMGTPDTKAKKPTSGRMVRGPVSEPAKAAPAKVGPSRHSSSKNRVAAKIRRGSSPHYPTAAKRDGVQGVVVLSITISANGHVESATVLRGLGHGLDESALRAARKSLWEPATIGGHAVRTTRRFNVRFTLQS